MAFSIFFALTVIINLTYAVSKKNLHLFEIFFIWMVTNIIHHNFMTIFALNMEMINFNSHSTSYWTMALIRVFLIPVLIIWYIDKTQGAKNRASTNIAAISKRCALTVYPAVAASIAPVPKIRTGV